MSTEVSIEEGRDESRLRKYVCRSTESRSSKKCGEVKLYNERKLIEQLWVVWERTLAVKGVYALNVYSIGEN
jgi:hypothetical protein